MTPIDELTLAVYARREPMRWVLVEVRVNQTPVYSKRHAHCEYGARRRGGPLRSVRDRAPVFEFDVAAPLTLSSRAGCIHCTAIRSNSTMSPRGPRP